MAVIIGHPGKSTEILDFTQQKQGVDWILHWDSASEESSRLVLQPWKLSGRLTADNGGEVGHDIRFFFSPSTVIVNMLEIIH